MEYIIETADKATVQCTWREKGQEYRRRTIQNIYN